MRLIDADALIEAINKSTCNWAEHLWKRVVCDVIGNQPTAFDAEKVVADLEKEKEIHTEHYNISIYKDFPEIKCRYKQIQGVINKAIDIVRKGGIK